MKFKLLLLTLLFPVTTFAADNYAIDPVHTFARFRIKHLDIGYTYGQFNVVSGNIILDSAAPEKSNVSINIKADSIDTNDAKRDKHLKSPDFFNSKLYPELSFQSTEVKKISDTEYEVSGHLTIHGVTKEATLKMIKVGEGQDPWGAYRIGYETSFELKRSDYGMGFMADKIGDVVNINFSAEATKK